MIGKGLCSTIAAAVLIAFGYPARYASISSDGRRALLLGAAIILAAHNSAPAETQPCHSMEYERNAYTVCEVDPRNDTVRLYWKRPMALPTLTCPPCREL